MIAALFIQRHGVYWGRSFIESWDEEADAKNYQGPYPVVAHPPCARWCRLAGQVEKRDGLKRGDDGGCFESALKSVRRWGGVLEHPAWTAAWRHFGLPVPAPSGGWQRGFCGGWTCHVEQGHYGHRAAKPTWLYLHGHKGPLPRLRWGPSEGERRAGSEVQKMSKRQRNATSIEFRDLLISLARSCRAAEA